MVCLLHNFFHQPANFTPQKITNHYELKTQRLHLFLVDLKKILAHCNTSWKGHTKDKNACLPMPLFHDLCTKLMSLMPKTFCWRKSEAGEGGGRAHNAVIVHETRGWCVGGVHKKLPYKIKIKSRAHSVVKPFLWCLCQQRSTESRVSLKKFIINLFFLTLKKLGPNT